VSASIAPAIARAAPSAGLNGVSNTKVCEPPAAAYGQQHPCQASEKPSSEYSASMMRNDLTSSCSESLKENTFANSIPPVLQPPH
jgi:hypothetical protein